MSSVKAGMEGALIPEGFFCEAGPGCRLDSCAIFILLIGLLFRDCEGLFVSAEMLCVWLSFAGTRSLLVKGSWLVGCLYLWNSSLLGVVVVVFVLF